MEDDPWDGPYYVSPTINKISTTGNILENGDLSGPIDNNAIRGWKTRAAALSLVTHGQPRVFTNNVSVDTLGDERHAVLKIADASLRPPVDPTYEYGDSSEIFQTRTTVVNRTYSISYWVWVDDTANTAESNAEENGGTYCTNKDINGILIIRNTVEDDSSNDAAFEALLCPSPAKAGSWQMVSGTYTATSNSTTFALHSEGVKSAYFDSIEVVDPYDRDVNSRNHPTTGSTSVTVHGSGFAGADATVMTRCSGTAAEATLWIADTSCVSMIPAGLISTQTSVMSIEGWKSTLTEAVSFDLPVPRPAIQNRPTISPLHVSTLGANSGLHASTLSLRLGSTAVEKSQWFSDSSLMCKVAKGHASTRRLTSTLQVRVGSLTEVHSYDVATASGPVWEIHVEYLDEQFLIGIPNLPSHPDPVTPGSIFIVGSQFGEESLTSRVRTMHSAAMATKWLSATLLTCKISSGLGETRKVAVTAGSQMGVGSVSFAISYDRASMFSFTYHSSFTNVLRPGARVHTVSGDNFGLVEMTLQGRLASSGEATYWTSDTSLSSKIASGHELSNKPIAFALTAGTQPGSLTGGLSYDSASISLTHLTNSRALASDFIALIGINVGSAGSSARSSVGHSAALATNWASYSSLLLADIG